MLTESWPTQLQNPPTTPFYSPVPQVIGVEITGRCQLQCHHCFNLSGPANSHELPLEIIEGLLDDMQRWGVKQLRLSGGEPTYHRQFQEIVSACHKRSISIALNTHGVYPSTTLTYLKTAPIDLFLISIDGLETNNDAIRGQGTFRRATHACQQLHQAGQKVMIGYHVGAGNRSDVRGLITLAAEMGIDIKIAPIRPVGRAVSKLPNALLQPQNYVALVTEIVALRRQFPHIKILTDFDILDDLSADACQPDANRASCKAGRTMVNINYDGEIYACAFFVTPDKEFSAGNIYHDSLEKTWQNSPIFQPFRIHQKSGTCLSCTHYTRQCAGGCPAIAHFSTSYLDAHDPTCFAQLINSPEVPEIL